VAGVIGYLEVELHIPHARSLKEKRSVLKRLIERVRSRFNASVGEVDRQNSHQQAVIGVAVVGSSPQVVDATLEKVVRALEELHPGLIVGYSKELL